jgi:signal transduction histidine kinase
LFLFVFASVHSQTLKLDSLKSVLDKDEDNRFSLLIDISSEYLDSIRYHDFVFSCLQEALDSAVNQSKDSLEVNIYNYMGLASYNVGDFENATDYFYKGLNLLDNSPNVRQQSKISNNLGMIFDELEDYNRALEFYMESYRLDSLSGNEEGLIGSYLNLGISYQNLKQFDLARENYNNAYQLAERLNDSLSMVHALNNQGTLAYDLKGYEESLNHYNQALELYDQVGDLGGVAFAKNNIGLVYLDQKQYPLAIKYFNEALAIATDLNMYAFQGDVFGNLSIYYEEVGDYKNAFEYYDKYNEVYDSLSTERRDHMIRKLEAQYRAEKKQREILELQQENRLQKELLSSTKNRQVYLYVIIFLVIVFLLILFVLLRKEKLLARELQEKTRELKKLNVAKDRFFSIIAHDLKNPFNALVSYTSLLRSEFDSFNKEELSQIITDLNNATEQGFALLENLLFWTRSQTNRIKVYKTFFNLKQIVDGVIGLANANLVAKSQRVEVDIDPELKVFADKDMIATVIRNLVFNSIKFSYPDTVIRIEGKRIGHSVQISVIDQGVGIDAEKQHKFFNYEENTTSSGTSGETGSGLGLAICREFVEKNNGLIWAESEPGQGATFRFTIPYVEPGQNT